MTKTTNLSLNSEIETTTKAFSKLIIINIFSYISLFTHPSHDPRTEEEKNKQKADLYKAKDFGNLRDSDNPVLEGSLSDQTDTYLTTTINIFSRKKIFSIERSVNVYSIKDIASKGMDNLMCANILTHLTLRLLFNLKSGAIRQ